MIPLQLDVAKQTKLLFQECLQKDVSTPRRKVQNRYIAPFETYAPNYLALMQVGAQVIDPKEAKYVRGREGNCDRFVCDILNAEFPIPSWRVQEIQLPSEDCLVIYASSNGGPLVRTHHGIFKEGKVISKWEGGPIFRHPLHSAPYALNQIGVENRVGFFTLN